MAGRCERRFSDDAANVGPTENETVWRKLEKKGRALELVAFTIDYPACWQFIKDRAAQLQARLEAELPPEVVASAKARAKSQTLDEVVAEILQAAHSSHFF